MDYIIKLILKDLEATLKGHDLGHFFYGLPEAEVAKNVTNDGVIFVDPVTSNTKAVTTGITDQNTHTIDVILAKNMQTQVYKNASQETGKAFLTRLMDGRKEDGSLYEKTVKYVIRRNLRCYGARQPEITIEYNDNRVDHEGVVTATLRITQEEDDQQTI